VTKIRAIAAGAYHSLALKSDGTLYVVGYNFYGQLGLGHDKNQKSWKQTSLTAVTAMAGGSKHSLALKSDGTVWGTGWNLNGQLGSGDNNQTYSWTVQGLTAASTPLTAITAIAAGGERSLALKSDGIVWVTGENGFGQLGLGDDTARYFWTKTSLTDVGAISAGQYHSFALKLDSTVWGTGGNAFGQLGLGSGSPSRIYSWTQSLLP